MYFEEHFGVVFPSREVHYLINKKEIVDIKIFVNIPFDLGTHAAFGI
jgi:hypothetical protein